MAYTTIDDPSAYFHTQLYTGNGSSGHSITNDANAGDFKPDWLWLKPRSLADNHVVLDSSRTSNKRLKINSNDAEDSDSTALITFETDGFDLDTTDQNFNQSSATYVAWQWKANGGTTSSNSDGGVTGTIQANTTAGFSIILYTGTGSASTVGHGLSDTPDWIIYKRRSGGTRDWMVYHNGTGSGKGMILNSTSAGDTASSIFGGNTPTSTTIPIGSATETNTSSESHIAYAFAEKQGYSKFGSYTGNGNADGPFIYTGFKPAWVMVKESDGTGQWRIRDNKRSTFNAVGVVLYANGNDAEATEDNVDFLSNGFKIRTSGGENNGSSDNYIYMAFAEHPFVSSKGVPTTAR